MIGSLSKWRGQEGWQENRGHEGCGNGTRRDGGKQDSQAGGNWEKLRNNFALLYNICNRNRTKMQEPLQNGVRTGSKRYS